jgi:hypothetical protein
VIYGGRLELISDFWRRFDAASAAQSIFQRLPIIVAINP